MTPQKQIKKNLDKFVSVCENTAKKFKTDTVPKNFVDEVIQKIKVGKVNDTKKVKDYFKLYNDFIDKINKIFQEYKENEIPVRVIKSTIETMKLSLWTP